MPGTHREASTFRVPAEVLIDVVTDPEFVEARHRVLGAASARCVTRHRDERRIVQEVEAEEYARTLTGIDHGRVERVVTTYEWSLPELRCTWRYRGRHGERVRVQGDHRIAPAPSGSELQSEFTVVVDMPLIGRRIEKRILSEIAAGMRDFDVLLRDFCDRRNENRPPRD
jgi:hypothetical protein